MRRLVILIGALLTAGQVSAEEDRTSGAGVGFQRFVLGQTIAEAREVQLPAGQYAERTLLCSSDPSRPSSLNLTASEIESGLVLCGPTQIIGGSVFRAELSVTTSAQASVDLYFLAGKLERIETGYPVTKLSEIETALTHKYGAPEIVEEAEVLTEAGDRYPSRHLLWTAGEATITLHAPAVNIRQMVVVYELPAGREFFEESKARAAAKADL